MYFPYLRGRQFELIALREFAIQRGDQNNIIGIIEPVKEAYNSIKLAITKLNEGNVKFAIVLNPKVGIATKPGVVLKELNEQLSDNPNFIPALIVNDNYNRIIKTISHYSLSNVMLICTASVDVSNAEFEELFYLDSVSRIVSPENRALKRKLSGKGKEIIRLDDNFKGQKRNSDYISKPDEKFTEEHMFFKEDQFQGFSDYTVVISDYNEGGAAPFAVAIHWTYKRANGEIWIRHFVSDTNDDRSNIQGKFAEAASKTVKFLDAENIHSYAAEELRKYYDNKTYPGLGMVKKIAIKNHLELINQILH